MRIAFVYLDKGGGIGQCSYQLAKVLAQHADITCYLAAQNTLLADFQSLPCPVKVFPLQRGWKSLLRSMMTRSERSGVAEAIKADAPDIILDAGSQLWIQLIERLLQRQFPVVEVIHDVNPHPGLRYPMYALHSVLYPSLADAVVSMSEYSHHQMVRKYPGKVHIRSRHGIIHGRQEIDPDAVAAKRESMLFFGQITAYKGIDVLVDAFKIAKQQNPDLELDIVGRGQIKPALLQQIKHQGIGLTNRYVSDEEVKSIISEHGIMVMPYASATQSGVAAVALANGLPGVATNVGALPEQIMDGRNGIVVPPRDPRALADAMVSISSDYGLARSMSEQALAIGREEYSWESIGTRLLSDLEAFLTSHTSN